MPLEHTTTAGLGGMEVNAMEKLQKIIASHDASIYSYTI